MIDWHMLKRGFKDSLPSAYRVGEALYFFGNLLLWLLVVIGAVVGAGVMISNYAGGQA